MANAPYTGGYSPTGQLFAVDGDFTQADPAGLPKISFPMKGDSILSIRDIAVINTAIQDYILYPLGAFPNIQPWSPNQATMVLEQEFVVAQSAFLSLPLNTPYNPAWAIGFNQTLSNGYPIPALNQFYLVVEGELEDMGGGICKIKRTFATLPPVRNEIEQYVYKFPQFDGIDGRDTPINVFSRIQYDYYIFDDLDILTLPVFPFGPRLDGNTGLSPDGLILPAFRVYLNVNSINTNVFVDVISGTGIDINNDTVPNLPEYQSYYPDGQAATSNDDAAELIAEASTMTRWMGNIWERRTRYVTAQ